MRWRNRSGREFEGEIQDHIAMLAQRFEARGMTPEEALREARRQFGNVTSLHEAGYEMRALFWPETFWRDVCYALRMLSRNKAFAAVAVLTLALGIGSNTAIFSLVNAALLRPLPYPDSDRLVVLWGNVNRVRVERRGASYPDFLDWRAQSHSFEGMAAFEPSDLALTGSGDAERISGEYVSAPYFRLLGVHAQLGRTFTPGEDHVPRRDAVVVLSDGLWKRRFAADPAIVGRRIQLDGHPFTVIGVLPPGFRGLSDTAEAWAPFTMAPEDLENRGSIWLPALARLEPGVSLARAQTEMDAISRRLAQAYPSTDEARGVEVAPLEEETFGSLRKPLLLLLAAVGFVLLIAAANVANLLLARWETRRREMAMRVALGASRGRLLRQLLAESLVVVGLGCAAGLALAHYGIRALLAASPLRLPSFVHVSADSRVMLFTALVCCMVALALGLAPAAQPEFARSGDAFAIGGGRSTEGRRSARLRKALVVAEVSLSTVLLVGAGLMVRSLRQLLEIDPGYVASRVLQFRVSLPQPASQAAAEDILRAIEALPAVESASIASDAPLTDSAAVFYTAEGQPPMSAQTRPRAYYHLVSDDFFRTLRTPFLAGRSFSAAEAGNGANVVIVTEGMARRFWRGENPIGKRIKIGRPDSANPWLTIIGVIVDLNYRGLPRNPTADPDLFLPFNQSARDFAVLVRSPIDPAGIMPSIRTALQRAQPSILIYGAGPLAERVGEETAKPRFTAWLMAIFAALALALAAVGIYGVISYSVSGRGREIGVRMALGARRREVLLMVLRQGMAPVMLGMAIGAAGAPAVTRILTAMIYGVSPLDGPSFAAAIALLLAAATTACLVPAARASRIDPAVTLRNE